MTLSGVHVGHKVRLWSMASSEQRVSDASRHTRMSTASMSSEMTYGIYCPYCGTAV